MKSIAEQIQIALKENNMTQKELAEKSGLTPSAITHYVKGTYKPTEENINKLARALNVTELWLKGFDNEFFKKLKEEKLKSTIRIAIDTTDMTKTKMILKLCEQLTNQGLDKVIAYIEDIAPTYRKEDNDIDVEIHTTDNSGI